MRQQAGIPARMRVTDQTGAAADLNKEQYAQTMGAYNAFQHRVKTSIIPTQSHVARLPGGGQVEMRHSFGVNTVRVVAPRQKNVVVVDADFLVITYGFTEADGLDLDTRTKLVAPFASNTVGWGRDGLITSDDSTLATWSGDNTGYGAESVFLDLQAIKKIYQSAPITFECRAFWYYQRLAGNCDFSVKAYKGGAMSESSYVFSNDGGKMVAQISKSANVPTLYSTNTDGDLVARIHYNPATNELKLE